MTPKQRIFADEYIKSRNATRAYMIAYPSAKNEATAASCATKLLRNAQITEYIQSELDKLHKSTIASAEEIMSYYSSVMRGELTEQVMTNQGVLADSNPKLSDRNNAAKLLSRMLGTESMTERRRVDIEREKWEREKTIQAEKTSGGVLDEILKAVNCIE